MSLPTVLFIPGTLCTGELFAPQVRFLNEHGIRADIAPLDGGNTMTAIAQKILAKAPEQFALVGLSMGGIIAFEIMRLAPERVTHLALLDTNSRAETPEKLSQRLAVMNAIDSIEIDGGEGLLPFVELTLFPNYTVAIEPRLSELRDIVVDMAKKTGWTVGKAQMQALNTRTDSFQTLSSIKVPTHVICGEYDKLCPIERHTFIAEHIPHAQLTVLSECGHLSTLEQPDKVNELLLSWIHTESPYVSSTQT